jgi:hypothetical protein
MTTLNDYIALEADCRRLTEALRACIDILDGAQSGFIPGCGADEAWKKGRDDRITEARAALEQCADR